MHTNSNIQVEFKQRIVLNGVKTNIYSIWSLENRTKIFEGYYSGTSAIEAYDNYEESSWDNDFEDEDDDFDDE